MSLHIPSLYQHYPNNYGDQDSKLHTHYSSLDPLHDYVTIILLAAKSKTNPGVKVDEHFTSTF